VCVCARARACVAGEAFDVVVCSEVLEHVSDLALMVRDLCKLVRKKDEGGGGGGGVSSGRMAAPGALYITTINRTNISYGLGMPDMFVCHCFSLFQCFLHPHMYVHVCRDSFVQGDWWAQDLCQSTCLFGMCVRVCVCV
jgi:hypothetical protein